MLGRLLSLWDGKNFGALHVKLPGSNTLQANSESCFEHALNAFKLIRPFLLTGHLKDVPLRDVFSMKLLEANHQCFEIRKLCLKCYSLTSICSNYSDLTRPHPKWWFIEGNPLNSVKSRLVKYYNLARSMFSRIFCMSKKVSSLGNGVILLQTAIFQEYEGKGLYAPR